MKIPTKKEKGFTLAETLITLTILGVVAAITVPSLINKQTESANRTKVKKAMAVYEKALNQMIIDNDIKGDVSALNGDTCATTRPYFKTIENGDNNCQFKTADRVWWDITDIENPIIAFKESDLKSATAGETDTKKAFYLIGRRDDNGILRINDKGFEDSIASGNDTRKAEMAKLYNFINNTEGTSGGGTGGGTTTPKTNADKLEDCATGSEATCTITYDCPTQEDPTKTCELEMTKQTFNTSNCDTSSLSGPSNSCPDNPITYIAIPEDQTGKSWDNASCPDGTHMAKAGELAQMTSVLTANCDVCLFWAQEDYPNITNQAYRFDSDRGEFTHNNKGINDSTYRVVCVGN